MYPADLKRFSGALLLPQPLTFHKPRRGGDGVALKLNLKFNFEFGEAEQEDGSKVPFLKKTKGGLFVDFAKQGPEKDGNATFKWTDRDSLVIAKLGQPDISAFLVGMRVVRAEGNPVPLELRAPGRDNDDEQTRQRKAVTVSLTHKSLQGYGENRKEATTIVSYQFMAQGGVFRVSKSREHVGQVQLSLAEELRFMRYLELSLDTILRVGAR